MTVSEFLNEKFDLNVLCDEEGVYSYVIHSDGGNIRIVDKTVSNVKLSKSVLLECDDNNFIAVKYFDAEGYEVFALEGTKIGELQYLDDEYEDINGQVNTEKALIFYSKTWDKRYLRIDMYEKLRISFDIDYDKYDTDDDGVIVWE